ncbi:MAG TPA: hypothetical protein VNK43_00120 [Gemmatimonadales bacterium]|nr:hypothetical protein [Gemmatimonadales bacterium]
MPIRDDAREHAILGIDYHEWNGKLINVEGKPESLGELFGWYVITSQAGIGTGGR